MATVQYGTLSLVPPPQVGISVKSNFFGADIRYSRTTTYSLKGTLLNNQQSGVSGIFLQQLDVITGFAADYQPFSINGVVIGYPKVTTLSFDESNYLQRNDYTLNLEFLDSGSPFQLTGIFYNLTGITGIFQNIQSLSENFNYNTDFRSYHYSHSVDISYRTGVNIDPLFNAKIIASGLINNKSYFPFAISGGMFGNTVYEEKTDIQNGTYSVVENFLGSTGAFPYNHTYSVNVKINENGITDVSEQGNIQGLKDPINNKYDNAKSGYAVIRNTIYDNCSGVYSKYLNGVLNTTFLTDSRIDDQLLGTIQYSRSFNDSTGIADTRWTYTNSINLNGNKIEVSEAGEILGLGHISIRFNQASGFFNIVKTGIEDRCINQYSGYQQTGLLYNIAAEQSYDRFHGQVSYNYRYSNNNNYGLGSGIRFLETTISDSLPTHYHVNFNVVHVGVVIQSLNATKQGERTINLNLQAFRETSSTEVLQFITNTLNKYRPIDVGKIDPFLNSLSLSQNPIVNQWTANGSYVYGGYRSDANLLI